MLFWIDQKQYIGILSFLFGRVAKLVNLDLHLLKIPYGSICICDRVVTLISTSTNNFFDNLFQITWFWKLRRTKLRCNRLKTWIELFYGFECSISWNFFFCFFKLIFFCTEFCLQSIKEIEKRNPHLDELPN